MPNADQTSHVFVVTSDCYVRSGGAICDVEFESETRLPRWIRVAHDTRHNFLEGSNSYGLFSQIIVLKPQPFKQHSHDMDAIQSAFGHDAALCGRILAAASKFYL